MTVSVLNAAAPLKANVSANNASAQSASNSNHPLELDHVSAFMLDALQDVMEGPANLAGQYQVRSGGSLLRAHLALASCRSFECSRDYAIAAAAACELIHNASLIHDDILDGDLLRRGQPTVWKQHGEGVALCAGDLLLCTAFAVAAGLENAEQSRSLTQYLAATASRVIVGQSVETAPREANALPRFRAYLDAARAKTVPLIELPLMAGAIAARAEPIVRHTLKRFAEAVGLAYQIIDDLDDLDDLSEPERRVGREAAIFHPFHAWHHHAGRQADSPALRVHRATRHALACVQRARRQLERLELHMLRPLTPTLAPLLITLESRAQAHRHICRLSWELAS
jgi:geranylgeranyl diphosphate synthase type II